ncbi:hypothetical protein LPJ75_003796 [Coemansia sp. RSA 2598]|nr:hypothetical protein LPJ75_003796 [Coemansia sp. RSA 2598]
MASKVFSSNKSKQQRPAKQAPLSGKPLSAAHSKPVKYYQETNYTQYKPGTNVNAHMKPLTYDRMSTTSSMVVNAGSKNSSPTQGILRPSKPSGYKKGSASVLANSAAGLAGIAAAGTAAASIAVANSAVASKEEEKKARHRWNQQASSSVQAAGITTAAPNNASYQAFDHSAGTQPLTSSVLAQHTYAYQHAPQPFPNNTSAVSAGAPAFAASAAYTAGAGVQSAAWSHEVVGPGSSRPPATYYGSGQKQQQKPANAGNMPGTAVVTAAPSIAPSELESDMAQAGFPSMHSMYDPKKGGRKNKQPVNNQVSAPGQPGNNNGYFQQQQQPYHNAGHQYQGQQQAVQYGPQAIAIPHQAQAVSGPSTGAHQGYVYANPQQQPQQQQQQPQQLSHYPTAPPIFQSQTYPQAGHYPMQQPGPQQYHQQNHQQNYQQPQQYNYQNSPQQQQQSYQQPPYTQPLSQSAPVIFSSMPQLNSGEGDPSYNQSMYFGSQPMPANSNSYGAIRPKKQVHFAI